ncbi:MAG: plasmid stabilization system protein ParE [Gammaproteobacteria bacterium]
MPNYQIDWLPGALQDMARVRQFLNKENPPVVKKASQRILSTINLLLKNPQAGMPSPDEDCERFRDLYAPFGRGGYTIRYRIKQQRIIIVRVWHSREERA